MGRKKLCERGTWRANVRTVHRVCVVEHMGQDSKPELQLRSKLGLARGSKRVLARGSKRVLELRSKQVLGFRSRSALALGSKLAERNVNGAF